jgi:arylsulfatase A-like enzyme
LKYDATINFYQEYAIILNIKNNSPYLYNKFTTTQKKLHKRRACSMSTKKRIGIHILLVLKGLLLSCLSSAHPRLTIILVIDQFANHYIKKLYPYLEGGIKKMYEQGIVYYNAYHPHGMPATATGHATLNAGTCTHGIIGNGWIEQFEYIKSDDDTAPSAAVLNPKGGVYPYAKSACRMVVEGLSDQVMRANSLHRPCMALSVSYKSRAAIGMAGTLGKAFWFDERAGLFTTSRAYEPNLPRWVQEFNKNFMHHHPSTIYWSRAHPTNARAYQFDHIDNYMFASGAPLIDTTIPFNAHAHDENAYEPMLHTPYANQLLLDFAYAGIVQHLTENPAQTMLIWIGLTSLDKIGHMFGPWAAEPIDMIYHLDHQVLNFMHKLAHILDPQDTLFVLTADHGVAPIAELLKRKGVPHARRLHAKPMIESLETELCTLFSVKKPFVKFKAPGLYLDKSQFDLLPDSVQKKISSYIIQRLQNEPGIKKVVPSEKLMQLSSKMITLDLFFKHQLFPGRSGDFIIQTLPHCAFYGKPTGAAHRTPYDYDTHVPLVFYQKGLLPKKSIRQKVFTFQLASTLADMLGIARLPTFYTQRLPGIPRA